MTSYQIVKLANESAQLNESFLSNLRSISNLHLLVFNGPTRTGKSTTCNQILIGVENNKKGYVCQTPFFAQTGVTSVTFGCDIVGPIKLKNLLNLNSIPVDQNTPDADILICDTEGFQSISGSSTAFIPTVITAMQIATTCVFFSKGRPTKEDCLTIQQNATISKLMNDIFKTKPNKPTLYSSNYQIDGADLPDDYGSMSLEQRCVVLDQQRKIAAENVRSVLSSVNNMPSLNIIIGGSYGGFNEEELAIYRKSVKEILIAFQNDIKSRGVQRGEDVANMIRKLFDFFKKFKEVPRTQEDFKEIISNIFEEVFKKEINNARERIIRDVNNSISLSTELYNYTSRIENRLVSNISSQQMDTFRAAIKQDKRDSTIGNSVRIIKDTIYRNANSMFRSEIHSAIQTVVRRVENNLDGAIDYYNYDGYTQGKILDCISSYKLDLFKATVGQSTIDSNARAGVRTVNEKAEQCINRYINELSEEVDDYNYWYAAYRLLSNCEFKEDVEDEDYFSNDLDDKFNSFRNGLSSSLRTTFNYLERKDRFRFTQLKDSFTRKLSYKIKEIYYDKPRWSDVKYREYDRIKDEIHKRRNEYPRTSEYEFKDLFTDQLKSKYTNIRYCRIYDYREMISKIYGQCYIEDPSYDSDSDCLLI